MKLLIACALAALAKSAVALHLHVSGSLSPRSASLFPRGNVDGSASQLNNSGNIAYRANITLGGQTWSTLIDTGRYVLTACPLRKFPQHRSILVLTFGLLALSQRLP
jgi:hypothetical protein